MIHSSPTAEVVTILACSMLLGGGCVLSTPQPVVAVELEAGVAGVSRNDAAVPGDTGTRFAIDDLHGSGPELVGRVDAVWALADRHQLRALYAPLTLSGTDRLARPVSFAGQSFAAGTPTEATYRFDSYRLTYRYRVLEDDDLTGWVGFTAKIRDAEIELRQGGVRARKSDTGFVPLLHLVGDWRFATDWRLNLGLDGSWAPQGRALDAALKVYWRLDDAVEVGLGYRTIEGGADNDEVYTFSWIHQAVLSFSYRF